MSINTSEMFLSYIGQFLCWVFLSNRLICAGAGHLVFRGIKPKVTACISSRMLIVFCVVTGIKMHAIASNVFSHKDVQNYRGEPNYAGRMDPEVYKSVVQL